MNEFNSDHDYTVINLNQNCGKNRLTKLKKFIEIISFESMGKNVF